MLEEKSHSNSELLKKNAELDQRLAQAEAKLQQLTLLQQKVPEAQREYSKERDLVYALPAHREAVLAKEKLVEIQQDYTNKLAAAKQEETPAYRQSAALLATLQKELSTLRNQQEMDRVQIGHLIETTMAPAPNTPVRATVIRRPSLSTSSSLAATTSKKEGQPQQVYPSTIAAVQPSTTTIQEEPKLSLSQFKELQSLFQNSSSLGGPTEAVKQNGTVFSSKQAESKQDNAQLKRRWIVSENGSPKAIQPEDSHLYSSRGLHIYNNKKQCLSAIKQSKPASSLGSMTSSQTTSSGTQAPVVPTQISADAAFRPMQSSSGIIPPSS